MSEFNAQIAEQARGYVGQYYRQGEGFQCANFTCQVLSDADADLTGRRSSTAGGLDNDLIGPRIERGEVASGDLIFIAGEDTGGSQVGGITHVGIADVDPDGTLWMIHRPGADRTIERVNITKSGYYTDKILRGYRRVNQSAITEDVESEPAAPAAQPANPAFNDHYVKRGETIASIARQYGITDQELGRNNPEIAAQGKIRIYQKLLIPVAPTTPAGESPPGVSPQGEAYVPGEPLPGTQNGDAFKLDPVALAGFIYKSLEGSPLIGMGQTGTKKVLTDGAAYGLFAGTQEEWTRLIVALIDEESEFDANKTGDENVRFGAAQSPNYAKGSHGALQLSPVDLVNYGIRSGPPAPNTEQEQIAELRDPIFNIREAGLKILTDLMTGKADATKNVNITRLGYSNPTNEGIQPAGANSVYESGAALAKYWSPFRGAFFDREDRTKIINTQVNNISIDKLTAADAALDAALKIIQAEADQEAQRRRETSPNPSPEPLVRSASGNRSNQQQNQNTRRESLKQPAPVQNELLYNNSTVINLPGGTIEINGADYVEGMYFASGNATLSLDVNGVKLSTTGNTSTYTGGNTYNTTIGATYNSSEETFDSVNGDQETRTGVPDYGGWEDLRDAMAEWALGNTGFRGDLTDGPSLEDPMQYSLGYHLPGLDDSRNVENPNLSDDLTSTEVLKGAAPPAEPEIPYLDTVIIDREGYSVIPGTGSPGAPVLRDPNTGGLLPGQTTRLIFPSAP